MNLLPTFDPKKRIQKQVRMYLEKHVQSHGGKVVRENLGTFSAISLFTRVWLLLIAAFCGAIVYYTGLQTWWLWCICLPIALFCFYQGIFGLRVDLKEHVDEVGEINVNDASIDEVVRKASVSIELSFGVVHAVVIVLAAIIEVLAAVLAGLAALVAS